MKYLYTIFYILFSLFLYAQSEHDFLSTIDYCTEIKLKNTDTKCGEWGGDITTIRVYKKDCKGEFYIDYTKTIMNCEDIIGHYSHEDVDIFKTIQATDEERKLIEQAITELLKRKLSNNDFFGHSGIQNSVVFSDSTLIIKDYPSIRWSSFEKLVHQVTKQ